MEVNIFEDVVKYTKYFVENEPVRKLYEVPSKISFKLN